MFDILESLLQGLNDYLDRVLYLFRKRFNYAEILRSSIPIDDALSATLLDALCAGSIPEATAYILLQYLKSRNQWEMLFIDSDNRFLGNRFLSDKEAEIVAQLDSMVIYHIRVRT